MPDVEQGCNGMGEKATVRLAFALGMVNHHKGLGPRLAKVPCKVGHGLPQFRFSALARCAQNQHPQRGAYLDASLASRSAVPDSDNTRVEKQVATTRAPFAFLLHSLLPTLLARLFGRCSIQPVHPSGSDTGGAKFGRSALEKDHARLVADGLAPTQCLLAPPLPVARALSPCAALSYEPLCQAGLKFWRGETDGKANNVRQGCTRGTEACHAPFHVQ